MADQEYLLELAGVKFGYAYTAAIFLFLPILRTIWILIVTMIKCWMPLGNLKNRYCSKQRKSWAVVTGATDGIGLGFCQTLTKLDFNVVLISRNPQKLRDTVVNLQKIRKEAKTSSEFKIVAFNFKDSSNQKKWQQLIGQLKELDIAILVNNVGTSDINLFEKMKHQFIVDIININCIGMAALTTEVLKSMEKRKEKSAIINLSSFMGDMAYPFITMYAATKAFNKELSNAISVEHPQIDVMCLKPMFVESPLSKQKKGFGVPSRQQCALDSLKELGWERQTYGYFSHRLMAFFVRILLPMKVHQIGVKLMAKKMLKKLFPDINL